MRIAQINNAYGIIGGKETVVKNIAILLSEMGIDNEVLALSDFSKKGESLIDGVRVRWFPAEIYVGYYGWSFALFHNFKRILNSYDALIIHYPMVQTELILAFSKLKRKSYFVGFYHMDVDKGPLINAFYNGFVGKRFVKECDEIIVTSPNILESSPVLRSVDKNKVRVLPLSVDTGHFYPRSDNKRGYLLSLFRTPPKYLVLYIGRLDTYKGLEYLVDASRFLPYPEFGIVIIGRGPVEKKLKKMVKKLGAGKQIKFHDHVSYEELPMFYSSPDVFVLPSSSRNEAFGIVALEAMACGTPVITTELGTGTTFHNIHGVTGLHVPPKDPKSLADAIAKICREGWKRSRAETIVKRAREFSNERFKEKLREILEEIESKIRNRSNG